MGISRRNLLRRIGAAAASTAAVPSLTEASLRAAFGEPSPAAGTRPPGGPIRLDRNENARGPSPKVIATMQEAARTVAHRYPDVESEALRTAFARYHSVPSDRVVLGCGSGELIRMAADAFPGLRKTLVVARPTYGLMSDCARRAGAEVVAIPLTHEYAHDLSAMLDRTDSSTGLVYICNPNNPTGTLTRRRDLEAFVRQLPDTTFVLIDEAYHHYVGESSDYASFIDRPIDDARVIVTRSFSKVYGLAGMRVGYGIAAPHTARLLASCRLREDVNVVAAKAAAAAVDDRDHVRLSAIRNADDRQEFLNQSHARMLKPIDSQTNFVMMNTGRPAADVIEHFRKHNVLIAGSIPAFDTHIRVSLGNQADMQEFWLAWDLMPRGRMSM